MEEKLKELELNTDTIDKFIEFSKRTESPEELEDKVYRYIKTLKEVGTIKDEKEDFKVLVDILEKYEKNPLMIIEKKKVIKKGILELTIDGIEYKCRHNRARDRRFDLIAKKESEQEDNIFGVGYIGYKNGKAIIVKSDYKEKYGLEYDMVVMLI